MATSRDECMPDDAFLALLVADVIRPRFASFESDACPPLVATLVVAVGDTLTSTGVVASTVDAQSEPNGELRVRFRRTGDPSRVLWRIESLFPGVMPSTGFVGFDTGGDARIADGAWAIRDSGWAGKYNVDHWHGWV